MTSSYPGTNGVLNKGCMDTNNQKLLFLQEFNLCSRRVPETSGDSPEVLSSMLATVARPYQFFFTAHVTQKLRTVTTL